MSRFLSILVLIAVAGVGTGALRYLHELDHANRDAREAAAASHEGDPKPAVPHDETNCFTHAQLNLSMVEAGYVAVLVCLGVFVAFLTMLPASPVRSRRPFLQLDSRGPPACPPFQIV